MLVVGLTAGSVIQIGPIKIKMLKRKGRYNRIAIQCPDEFLIKRLEETKLERKAHGKEEKDLQESDD